MGLVKNVIKKYFNNFSFFYGYLGHRMFVAIGLSILVGVLDGLGIAMFLPLLKMVSEGSAAATGDLGYMSFVVDFYTLIGVRVSLAAILITMVLFFVLKGLATYAKSVYNVKLLELFSRMLRMRTLAGLNALNYKTFVVSDMGRIQNSMTGEIDRVVRSQVTYFGAMQQSVMVLVYAIFAFLTDYRFAFMVVIGGLLINFFYQLIYKQTKKASRELSYHYDVYEGQIIQHVKNFKYIKATGLLNYFGNRLKKTILDIQDSRVKIGMLSSFMAATREPILVIIVSLVIFIQTSYLGGELGTILLSLLFFYRALTSVTILQNNWNQFLGVHGSVESIKEFFQNLNTNKEPNGNEKVLNIQEGLKLQNISFKYDTKNIIEDLSLNIERNKSYAFVGESGSGKTTIVNILAALLPPGQGNFEVDQRNIMEIEKASYQQRIGYITQEPVVFDDSIYNNVTLWAEENKVNQDRFAEAIEKASLTAFISELDLGKETVLGHGGINLSGGQRQRLSIARELFKEIDILIMDEATSALDSETERSIQDNIDALHGKYTLLIVAHRLSTIRNVDEVIFMDRGKIIAQDTFEGLTEKLPKFKKMVRLQEL